MAGSPNSCDEPLLKTVLKTVANYKMFGHGDSVLVGVSGGPDSVALLHILWELAPRFSLRLGVAHFNHGLRGEAADQDGRFVAALSRSLGLPCHSAKQDVHAYQRQHGLSPESAARTLRYRFYEQTASQGDFDRVALGHHRDDNAEQVLLYLIRGGGTSGLSGIQPVRGRFIRPLFDADRAGILEYLASRKAAWVEDASNQDRRFLRNRIRHQLLPLLEEAYNPRIREGLNRAAAILRDEADWAEQVALQGLAACQVHDGDLAETPGIELLVQVLNQHHPAIQRRILRRAVAAVRGHLGEMGFFHIEAMRGLCEPDRKDGHLDLPAGVKAARQGDILALFRQKGQRFGLSDPAVPAYQYRIPRPEWRLAIPEAGAEMVFSLLSDPPFVLDQGPRVALFDRDKLTFPLTVRNFQPGDRFAPLGPGGSRKLKKFFIDKGVDRKQRHRLPLLVDKGRILWVCGLRQAEPAKVTRQTRQVVQVRVLLAQAGESD